MALDHSLTHSLTRFSLIYSLKSDYLPTLPVLSITFIPRAFYVYVWNILEGTSKANFFPDTLIIEIGFV